MNIRLIQKGRRFGRGDVLVGETFWQGRRSDRMFGVGETFWLGRRFGRGDVLTGCLGGRFGKETF